ncbi:ATP-binding cassette domain-containing protein [Bradyrhizobium tropiciagri]|uniref:ATP-binding cassette domain-containing protein n=1 Tax=Bradyrhizobium tropiciagri TaxID=312253 RepID=UPI0024BF3433|nr:ATP-binding cassette domain-containing protein [Bradyrhizobium tropiciagri]
MELRGLVKRFGSFVAVDDVSLTIDHGQLVCLLGPSGCGKTTTLRLIAGFLEPSDGEIRVATAWCRRRHARCRPSSATCQ